MENDVGPKINPRLNSQLLLIKKIVNKNFSLVLLILALTIATIYVSPHFLRSYFLEQADKSYFPLNPETYIDEVNVTGPRIREVIEGKFIVRDIDTYEYLGKPFFMPPLPPLLLAPISLLTGDVVQTIIISDFIFPYIFFFIFYWIGIQLFRNKYFSVFFSVVITLFPNIGKFVPPLSIESLKILIANILPIQLVTWSDKLGIILRESYIPDFIIFGPALLFLLLAVRKKRNKYFLLTAVFFGLTFYTYPFHWIFLSIASGLLAFQYFLDKDFKTVTMLTATVTGAYAVGAYYFVNYFRVVGETHGQEIFDRVWMEKTHLFRLSDWEHYLVLFLLAIIVYVISRKHDRDAGKWLIALLASGFVVLNMQVITGVNISPIHWIPRTNVLAINFAVFYILYHAIVYFKINLPKIYKTSLVLIIIFTISLLSGSVHQQYFYAERHFMSFTMKESKIDSLNWLDSRLDTDDVVMVSDLDNSLMIPLHTKGRLYAPRALNTYASNAEMIERFYIMANVLGWSQQDLISLIDCKESNLVDEGFYKCNGEFVHYLFHATYMGTHLDAYKYKGLNPKQKFPKTAYHSFIDNYRQVSEVELVEKLSLYRINYLYVDNNSLHANVNKDKVKKYFNLIHSHQEIDIYSFKGTGNVN